MTKPSWCLLSYACSQRYSIPGGESVSVASIYCLRFDQCFIVARHRGELVAYLLNASAAVSFGHHTTFLSAIASTIFTIARRSLVFLICVNARISEGPFSDATNSDTYVGDGALL